MSLLAVEHLQVSYPAARPGGRRVQAVGGLSFALEAGETLAIVGESGSGKSQTALALMGLLPDRAAVSGSVRLDGQELLGASEARWATLRGARIAMVFQDPMTALNPYLTIGIQLSEVVERHRSARRSEGLAEAARMLDAVRLPDALRRLHAYPHELSGGQRQRVMIAMALIARPAVLIADEPTTALDATVQGQVIGLLAELRRAFGLAIVLISHDLGLVAGLCAQTLVMYAGQPMERSPTEALMRRPAHPYTQGLLDARPRLDSPRGIPLPTIPGRPPALDDLPPGCPFSPRCAFATEVCKAATDELSEIASGRFSACVRMQRG